MWYDTLQWCRQQYWALAPSQLSIHKGKQLILQCTVLLNYRLSVLSAFFTYVIQKLQWVYWEINPSNLKASVFINPLTPKFTILQKFQWNWHRYMKIGWNHNLELIYPLYIFLYVHIFFKWFNYSPITFLKRKEL